MKYYYNEKELNNKDELLIKINYTPTYDILIKNDESNWLEISKEIDDVAIAWNYNNKIMYSKTNEIKIDSLIEEYIKTKKITISNRVTTSKNIKTLKNNCKNLFFLFLIMFFLNIIKIFVIIYDSGFYGNNIKKIIDYYCTSSLHPIHRSLPILLLISLIFFIVHFIIYIKAKKN